AGNDSPDGGPAIFIFCMGLLSFCWAIWLMAKLRNFKRRAKMDMTAADLAKGFKKALLAGAAQGAVVLKSAGRDQQYYGEGKALYETCLNSPKASRVIRAVA